MTTRHYKQKVGVLLKEIDGYCKTISAQGTWNPYQAVQKAAGVNYHPKAIAYVLKGMVSLNDKIRNPFPYFWTAVKSQSAKEFLKIAEQDNQIEKREWEELAVGLREYFKNKRG